MPAGSHIADRLNAWLAGSLPEAEAREVREHLASCAACEEERRLLEAGRTVLGALPVVEPRDWFATKVAASAAQVRPRPLGAPWWRVAFGGGLIAGAVAALALFVVPALHRQQQAAPRDEIVLAQRLDLFEDLGIVQNEDALEDFEVVEVLHTLQPEGRP
jgi:anti-sigma factor RsiW